MPRVRVVVHRDGRVEVEGLEYLDDTCLRDLNALLQSLKQLGVQADVELQQLKPEAAKVAQPWRVSQ